MNIGAIIPPPNIATSRPIKISPNGNLYKIPISHLSSDGKTTNTVEVWTTKEAVQKHMAGYGQPTGDTLKEYELKKFARQTYEKQFRSNNGALQHKGIFVTTDSISHGDPRLWPSTISHPEVKI